MKNTQGKMRKYIPQAGEPKYLTYKPYEIWKSFDGSWTWYVLKKWQADDSKQYARWFCLVTSPIVPEGEMGDVYVSEIKSNARKVFDENLEQFDRIKSESEIVNSRLTEPING
jgi:hypothetical protein